MSEGHTDIQPAPDELRRRVESQKDTLELRLERLEPGTEAARLIEGKLRDLDQIMSEDWPNVSEQVVRELERWLADEIP